MARVAVAAIRTLFVAPLDFGRSRLADNLHRARSNDQSTKFVLAQTAAEVAFNDRAHAGVD